MEVATPIVNPSYSELKEQFPRFDHRLRVMFKAARLLTRDLLAMQKEFIVATGIEEGETKFDYFERRTAQRGELMEVELNRYILEKELGTKSVRGAIIFRQNQQIQEELLD